MAFNFFNSSSRGNGVPVAFTPLPGTFSDEADNEDNLESNSNTNGSASDIPRLIKVCLYVPLTILYYVLNLLLTLVGMFKPVSNIFHFYTKKDNHFGDDMATQFVNVIDSLSAYTAANERSGYTFEVLYNIENGVLSKNMLKGGYTDILHKCSNDAKIAILYFFDPLLYDPYEYLSKILTTTEFVECVKKYNCLVWFCDVTTPQGLQTANALKVRQFPFLGALAPRSSNKMKLIARVEGPLFDYDFSRFESKLSTYYPTLLEIRRQRQYEEVQRLLREQQDSRFQDSLRRDQERDRAAEEVALKSQWLIWRKSTLAPEPASGGCRVNIRLENERVIRRFDENLPIEEIYAYIALKRAGLLSPNDTNSDEVEGEVQRPNYDYQFDFELYSPVPRTYLEPSTLIKDEDAIYPSGTIIVESAE